MSHSNNNFKQKRSTILNTVPQQESIIIQKSRAIPSRLQTSHKDTSFSFGELPNFTSYIGGDNATISRKNSYYNNRRMASVHTLNLTNDYNEFGEDLPPLKSQMDENLKSNEQSEVKRKYHNYNSFENVNNSRALSSTFGLLSKDNIRNSSKSTTIFPKKINPTQLFAKSSTPKEATNSTKGKIHNSKSRLPNLTAINNSGQDNIIQQNDLESVEFFKKICVNIFKIIIIIISFLYHLVLKLHRYLSSEYEEVRNPESVGQKPNSSSVMDIDTPDNSVTSEVETPLARKTLWRPSQKIDQSFNVSSLNWGSKKIEDHSPVKLISRDNDYGTHFINEDDDDITEELEPNIELEYIRKIFNNDGKFELQLGQNVTMEDKGFKQQRQSSISRLFNLSETFRNVMNVQETGLENDGEIEIIKNVPQSKFEIQNNDDFFKKESLVLFEEEFKTYQAIIEEKRRRQELIKNLKTQKESKIKKLDLSQILIVNNYLHSSNNNQTVKTINGIDLKVKDLKTLENSRWLNDNVIDSYLSLITKRSQQEKSPSTSFSFTTHFYSTLAEKGYKSVQRWAKRQKIDVTKLDYIFVPINSMNTHWSLGVINNKHQKFQYFDSLSFEPIDNDPSNDERYDFHRRKNLRILQNLITYMTEEDKRLHNGQQTIDFTTYQLLPLIKSPQQKNGSDCGVFTCTTVEFLARDEFLKFSQSDMENLRLKMCYELLTESLL